MCIIPRFLVGAGIAAICAATPAFAQESRSDSNFGDIIVTARRVEERLQDVPMSISVISQERLSNSAVMNAGDLAKITAGLQATPFFGNDNTTFRIRGFVQDIGTAPTVGVYFGDVVAPRGGSVGYPSGDGAGAGNFFDLQNVQVLKGPQGTLQGRSADSRLNWQAGVYFESSKPLGASGVQTPTLNY